MATPPIDKGGEAEKAARKLKQIRHIVEKFAPEWQLWIAESLMAGIQKPTPAVSTPAAKV